MGADYRALGVARSLGRRGIPVWIFNQGGHLVAAVSRYVRRRLEWPAGKDHEKVQFLLNLCTRHKLKGWTLVPTDDYTVGLVSAHHKILASEYQLTVPPWETLRWVCDKRLLHQLAEKIHVDQPWTACPSDRDELLRIDCPYPVILKPALRLQPSSLAVPKAWVAENRESLLAKYDEACAVLSADDLIVQEIVPGGGESQFSYAALCKDGFSLASLVARRTRQFPKDFGQLSTFVETVDAPEVVAPAERLLSAIGFTGLAEIEFKRDPRNNRWKILDINPRVWGWHTLSRRAGILAGRMSLVEYLRSIRGPLESAMFSWDDPLPGLLDLPLFAYGAAKRLLSSSES